MPRCWGARRRWLGSGVQVIALLALNDAGAPSYDRDNEARFAAIGIPCFACTPDLFPDLMAAVIERRSLGAVDFAGGHRGMPDPGLSRFNRAWVEDGRV
jgi:hypothetical protein